MKFRDNKLAYQLQKKYQSGKNIIAYKVGASNYRSNEFFGSDEILLGSLSEEKIHFANVTKNYPVSELEIVVKLNSSSAKNGNVDIQDLFIGIECPEQMIENPEGDSWICIADNCCAGDLIIYEKIDGKIPSQINIFANDELISTGKLDSLCYSIDEILMEFVSVVIKNNLQLSNDSVYVATGGISETFFLSKGMNLRFDCEF